MISASFSESISPSLVSFNNQDCYFLLQFRLCPCLTLFNCNNLRLSSCLSTQVSTGLKQNIDGLEVGTVPGTLRVPTKTLVIIYTCLHKVMLHLTVMYTCLG